MRKEGASENEIVILTTNLSKQLTNMVDRSFNHLNLFVCLLFIEKGESKKTLESGWDMYDSIEKRK